MGPNWVVLSMDEVYVEGKIPAENLLAIAVHPVDAKSILEEFMPEFRRLSLPVYLHGGKPLWPAP